MYFIMNVTLQFNEQTTMKKYLSLSILFIAFMISSSAQAQNTGTAIITGQRCEYYPAKTILMHEPGKELFYGIMHPNAALFDVYFDEDKAASEHTYYRKALSEKGIKVLTVKEVLLQGCTDAKGNTVRGQALDDLRNFAAKYLVYDVSNLSDTQKPLQAAVKDSVLSQASPSDLLRIIMLQPKVTLFSTTNNTELRAEYHVSPIMNLYFTRDQSVTTAKGTVICKMNSEQRQQECDILEFCYKKLGVKPIWKVEGEKAFLEGGDFIPFGNKAFIGMGMRTTQEAINQLMDNDIIGADSVIVVKDFWRYQAQMHLDTHFNIIDHDLATMTVERVTAPKGDKRRNLIDLYIRKDAGKAYKLVKKDIDFVDFITKEEKMKVIPISEKDQLNYANNFLAIAPREIMAVDGQSDELHKAFEENGVTVHWIPLFNLTRGFGAAHCMTQVLQRADSTK